MKPRMSGTRRRGAVEGIGEAPNRGCRAMRQHHQPKVKPDRAWQAWVLPNEGMAGLHNPSLLAVTWPPLRHVPAIDGRCAPGPAFDLVEHQGVAMHGNHIDFMTMPSPVPCEDAVTFAFQRVCHTMLPECANPGAAFQNHGATFGLPTEGGREELTCDGRGLISATRTPWSR